MKCPECSHTMEQQADVENGLYQQCPNCGFYVPVDVQTGIPFIFRGRVPRKRFNWRAVIWWAHVVTVIPVLLVFGVSVLQGLFAVLTSSNHTETVGDRFSAWADKGKKS